MSRSIGRYLVELLAANGIDTVFGIPGVHNLELYRGLAACGMRHVLVRHEQGAGFAADGYARLSGRPAAAFTISGPGLTNILTAVAQAYSDSIPLLVVATTPVRASLGKQWGVLHELQNQWALAAGVFGVARAAAERGGRAGSSAPLLGIAARRAALAPPTWKFRSTCCPSRRRCLRTALPTLRPCRRRRPRKSRRRLVCSRWPSAPSSSRAAARAGRGLSCTGCSKRSIARW